MCLRKRLYSQLFNDAIRDAILTCARKPTWIGLIYRSETTTKNCKTEKLKSKSRYVRSNSKSLGNHVVRSEKKKKKGCCGKNLQKKVLSLVYRYRWHSIGIAAKQAVLVWACAAKRWWWLGEEMHGVWSWGPKAKRKTKEDLERGCPRGCHGSL